MNDDGEKGGLGKIFLSHSSVDKPFVRKLEKRLIDEGFETWLDEKVLLVGDALVPTIAHAINQSRAVIIVVSNASIHSKWLRYELNAATQRMIQGGCRVLPVVIDDVDVPSEIATLLYADFRKDSRRGMQVLLNALEFESSRYPEIKKYKLDSVKAIDRQFAFLDLLKREFDGHSYVDQDVSATRSLSWEVLNVNQRPDPEISVAYKEVADYTDSGQLLSDYDWKDFVDLVHDEYGERYGLLISQRAPEQSLRDALYADSAKVLYQIGKPRWKGDDSATILLDVSDGPLDKEARLRILRVRALLIRLDREFRDNNMDLE